MYERYKSVFVSAVIPSFLLIVYKNEVGALVCSSFALVFDCPRISRKTAGGYGANVTCLCRGLCRHYICWESVQNWNSQPHVSAFVRRHVCWEICSKCTVLANENYQLTRPVASPNVKTQCHYVGIGITYVTTSWATADCERAILGPRNSAVDISREVLQLLLGDVKEYTNQWIQLRMFTKHCDVRDWPGILAGVSVNLIDQPVKFPSIELHWTLSFISSWQFPSCQWISSILCSKYVHCYVHSMFTAQVRRCPNMLSSLTLQYLTFCLRFVFSNWSVLLRLSDQWFLFSVCPMRATLFCLVFLLLTRMSSYVTRPPCASRALASK